MILPHEVVQVGLIQELVSVDVVEKASQTNERAYSHDREPDAVPGEEALLGDNGPVRIASRSDQIVIAIDVEVEDEAEDDRVDLEVDSQPEEKAREDVPAAEEQVHGHEDQRLYDLIIRATAAHCEKEWVEDQRGNEASDCLGSVGPLALL